MQVLLEPLYQHTWKTFYFWSNTQRTNGKTFCWILKHPALASWSIL